MRLASADRPPPPASVETIPTLSLPDKPSIAVLPFQNMSGDPEQEYFADGMVEEIITAPSRIRWLFVIARNSSFSYKGQSPDVKQVGRELGVRYVLEGSVRKGGGRVRITAQLIDALTGTSLWADHFDEHIGGLPTVIIDSSMCTTLMICAARDGETDTFRLTGNQTSPEERKWRQIRSRRKWRRWSLPISRLVGKWMLKQ